MSDRRERKQKAVSHFQSLLSVQLISWLCSKPELTPGRVEWGGPWGGRATWEPHKVRVFEPSVGGGHLYSATLEQCSATCRGSDSSLLRCRLWWLLTPSQNREACPTGPVVRLLGMVPTGGSLGEFILCVMKPSAWTEWSRDSGKARGWHQGPP